jgi:hemin uptake protein HemP
MSTLLIMTDTPSEPPAPREQPPAAPVRIVRSQEILQGAKEVMIDHDGELYRLRLTRNGRLVLYK